MENKFTIGQMAKLHNVPVKTLRYYDEIGLFKPNEVDPKTGYRYYTVEQFKLLDIINYLKMLGVPLREIKKQISNRDIRGFINTLHNHQKITEWKIRELQIVKRKIEERIKEFEAAANMTNVGVPFIKTLDGRTILQWHEPIRTIYDLELSLRKIQRYSRQFASIIIGKVGFTLSETHVRRQHFTEYSSIFLLLEEVEKGHLSQDLELAATLPAGEYACMYYRGAHSDAAPYVQQLYDYLQSEGYRLKGDFIIRTIIDQYVSKNADEHLSEIQVQVGKDG